MNRHEGADFQDFRSNKNELLTGTEVADMVKELFDRLPIEYAASLVDSNVVLTLANFKGQTEFFIDVADEKDDENFNASIELLADELAKKNPKLSMFVVGDPFLGAGDKKRTYMVNLMNLEGYERGANNTKIPGVPKYNSDSGMDGLDSWRAEIRKSFPYKTPSEDISVGLAKGYPDKAILDFVDWRESGRKKKIDSSEIPYVGTYEEAEPNYFLYSEHLNDPEVKENISQAGQILEEFYNSDWHKSVSDQLAFHRRPKI